MDHTNLYKEKTMLKTLKTKTQLMSAAMMTGAMVGLSGQAKAGNDLNSYTTELAGHVSEGWVGTITNISLLGGVALAALGVVNLKQHVENPSQTPMKNGLAKLGFGGILMVLGPAISAVQGTAGAESSAISTQRFDLNIK
jgi:hypothetical protein